MSDVKTLYDDDFVAWSREQAAALRAAAQDRSNRRLDWENLAEEIESLGVSQKSALGSQIRRIIEHLLQLENSRARNPRRGWRASVVDARIEIEVLLERNPSLVGEVDALIIEEHGRGYRKAIAALDLHRDISPKTEAGIRKTTYSGEQILGDWFPPDPAA